MNLIIPDDLDISPIVTCTIEGVLEEEDLLQLAAPSPDRAQAALDDPADLSKLREKHHSVARLIAQGLTQRLVATLSGYSEGYLGVLLANPSMQELVAFYRGRQGEAAQVIGEKLRAVGVGALDSLSEDLDAGKLSGFEKLALAKLGLDRSGHGPTSTTRSETVHHLVDHAELQKLNAQAREGSRGKIISMEAVRQALPPPDAEPGSGS